MVLPRGEVEFGCGFELLFFLLLALLLEPAQLGCVFSALALEACFLDLQVSERFS